MCDFLLCVAVLNPVSDSMTLSYCILNWIGVENIKAFSGPKQINKKEENYGNGYWNVEQHDKHGQRNDFISIRLEYACN